MNEARLEISDGDRARLRAAVAAIDRELSCLGREASATEHRSSMSSLVASWAALVEVLALGPAPERRECFSCKRSGMRAATRCGYCWVELVPPARAS
jgi:hypothetical protein